MFSALVGSAAASGAPRPRGRQELAARYLRLPNTKIAQKPNESRKKPNESSSEPSADLQWISRG